MSECIFCKIAEKKIKAEIVSETGKVMVIKDINPQAPTHLLIIPKAHYPTLMDCEDRELLGELLQTAQNIARELGLEDRGFRTVINTNEEAGQTVFHLHMHFMAGRPLTGRMG
ncbi:MAG: histidine triad nucleotide-binding protein [Deltaproteobacteria bacterium GWA2_54_12]|nr:MAG: histidine triad nucleotide-binding protein [Deltaproteobacteria bacterium GWA2_54_12]